MANRQFNTELLSFQKRLATVYGVFSVSGTTPALQQWKNKSLGAGTAGYVAAATTGGSTGLSNRYGQGCDGIFSVARTATGLWTVTLQDQYIRVMNVTGSVSIAGGATNIVSVAENSSITNLTGLSTGGGSIIGVALLSATATLADPTSGSIVRIQFDLQDATEA